MACVKALNLIYKETLHSRGDTMKKMLKIAAYILLAATAIGLMACEEAKDNDLSILLLLGGKTSSSKDITSFSFEDPAAAGVITGSNIAVTVPYGTDVTALVATFAATGASVTVIETGLEQTSGSTPNDFTTSRTYRVTAADKSTQDYTVSVEVAKNSAKEITAFGIVTPSRTGVISGTNIVVPVSNSTTDKKALIATFTTNGVSVTVVQTGAVQTSGTTSNDFTGSLTYRVAAEDGTTQDYTVSVLRLPAVTTTAIAGNLTFTVDIAGTSAKGGGDVTDAGDSAVTERGVCWNTSGTPTISDSHATNGSGTGVFTGASMSALAVDTVYYVRAYAANSLGTSYGAQITFNSGKAIGTDYQGGWVFYNNGYGHGLISGKYDIGAEQGYTTAFTWGYEGVYETSSEIGTGLQNTNTISAISGPASGCLNYTSGDYDDWYMPSINELLLLGKLRGIPGCNIDSEYWSSTAFDYSMAYYITIGNIKVVYYKTSLYNVRPIRNF